MCLPAWVTNMTLFQGDSPATCPTSTPWGSASDGGTDLGSCTSSRCGPEWAQSLQVKRAEDLADSHVLPGWPTHQAHPISPSPMPTHSRISSMIFCFSSISSRSLDSCFWWASRWLSICCSSAFCKPGRESVSSALALSPDCDKSWILLSLPPAPRCQIPKLWPQKPACFTETTKPRDLLQNWVDLSPVPPSYMASPARSVRGHRPPTTRSRVPVWATLPHLYSSDTCPILPTAWVNGDVQRRPFPQSDVESGEGSSVRQGVLLAGAGPCLGPLLSLRPYPQWGSWVA